MGTISPEASLRSYYRRHARFYDRSRWAFLLGRNRILQLLADVPAPRRILEIGCGTGTNLEVLARTFPLSELRGLDLSGDMLARAQDRLAPFGSRIRVEQHHYGAEPLEPGSFGLILFSYSLSMMNPGWEEVLGAAREDLESGGLAGVVDFHDTAFGWFARWMRFNHVRMEGHLPEALATGFRTRTLEIPGAFLGLWRYFIFIGEKTIPTGAEGS